MALPEINIINGRLGADPELRFTQTGKAVVSFNVASSSRKKNEQTGQWEDGDTTWTTINVWDGLAENIAAEFQKGSPVSVRGVLKQRSYEKDGQKRTVFEVLASEVSKPVSRFKQDGGQGAQQGRASRQQSNDPWGSQPQGGFGGGQQEPPF